MKDPWTDIHDRMNNFELPEPDGLWDGIESRLDHIAPAPRRRWRMITVARRVLDVAAAVALLLMLFNLSLPEADLTGQIADATGQQPATPSSAPAGSIAAATETLFVAPQPADAGKVYAAAGSVHKPSLRVTADSGIHEVTPAAEASDSTARTDAAIPAEETSTEETPAITTGPAYRHETARQTNRRNKPDRTTGRTRLAGGGLKFNLFTNGTLATAEQPAGGHHDYTPDPFGPSNILGNSGVRPMSFPIPADPLVPSQLYGLTERDKDQLYKDLHHHQPVRVGLTVSYPVSQRVAVETGLSYTYLGSEMKDGTDANFTAAKQELHYLGVPVNLKWRAMNIDRVHLYLSAGGMGEKCVSGRRTERLVIENKENQTNTEKIHIKQLQWSANAAVGVECELTPLVGLYAEPGVSYFFDDGSKVSTIYKEKPWNFNIQVGVRLNLGQ